MKKEFKNMLPMTELDLADFKKNPIPMKKETLEEAVGNYVYSTYDNQPLWEIIEKAVKFGAKWQQKNSYSEEDLKQAFQNGFTNGLNIDIVTFEDWFEQFKKK